MEFISLLVFVSGIIVALLTLYFSPDFGRAKPNKRNLSIIFLSVALVGIGLWFYSIDHPTIFCPNINAPPNAFGIFCGQEIPPPWYANLWPETLVAGVVLLLISVILLIRRKPSPL
ncbi:hypothetical protein [Saccharolobus shibatae]|uniref:Uncharacterized protein n=1 Tax=Saccharolobus shibatae TaxID=2286 RepID=A0A8F5BXI3_9CREN|nr:hypothetical protein [Saccharolobus shibatae]QXJ33200.1 hypothetical protein J5U21_02869 [Saccharolobus shibatae]QXJ36317.1 hypothetical protein J5U22_02882 [Saccharolobus shibatae]